MQEEIKATKAGKLKIHTIVTDFEAIFFENKNTTKNLAITNLFREQISKSV